MKEPAGIDENKKMIPGRKYRIEMDDCCIEGHFIATFKTWCDYVAMFDTAQMGPEWGKWHAEEID